jgi:hypothetical protein
MDRVTRQQYEFQEPALGCEWNLNHQFDWLIVDEAHWSFWDYTKTVSLYCLLLGNAAGCRNVSSRRRNSTIPR